MNASTRFIGRRMTVARHTSSMRLHLLQGPVAIPARLMTGVIATIEAIATVLAMAAYVTIVYTTGRPSSAVLITMDRSLRRACVVFPVVWTTTVTGWVFAIAMAQHANAMIQSTAFPPSDVRPITMTCLK